MYVIDINIVVIVDIVIMFLNVIFRVLVLKVFKKFMVLLLFYWVYKVIIVFKRLIMAV